MSQKENENDIWEYKPLGKKKKRHESSSPTIGRCTSKKSSSKRSSVSKLEDKKTKKAKVAGREYRAAVGKVDEGSSLDLSSCLSPVQETKVQGDNAAEGPSSEDFCPICQMPFFILAVQSQRWHVAECLDAPRDECKECPDGLQCFSTIPAHYKKFNHTLLARSRANIDTAIVSLTQQAGTSGESSSSCGIGLLDNQRNILETSQNSTLSSSASSSHTGTPQSKCSNGLLLLRSPGPEDFKKKKGWSSSTKGQTSVSASQESKKGLLSIPGKKNSRGQTGEGLYKREPSPENEDAISYSPLSEFPTETEDNNECRRALFNNNVPENEEGDSITLFTDSFSSEDELLTEFINNNLEANDLSGNNVSSSNTQVGSVSSLAPTNQCAGSIKNSAEFSGAKAAQHSSSKACIQSPQSIVLECLRETLSSSDNLYFSNLNDSSIQTEEPNPEEPSSESSTIQRTQAMPPLKRHGKTGQSSSLKQTDIGVFFGLKPLKEKEAESGPSDLNTPSVQTVTKSTRQRKTKAGTSVDELHITKAAEVSVGDQGEAGRRGTRGQKRLRWNRGSTAREGALPRCPFYKKIPGTKFAIDAFRYGEIEGISAYFLTHFHSDHYGGLTKNSTFPIYCNRITGNLVKSKLKVAEEFVHILPMNTEVTIGGVRVILLDANHCPGAAMLLFFLPDGQTVLHTGDFRADPSMETYPELLSCRVQTVYLDTTYCSPEYTFPRQQEVINFAASTAFELVTLTPRTLVVCGSYSVGKEKVFLALAEILGSKVCLSRDKYNTMCCLESKQIRELITTDWKVAQVHVLPMMQLSFKKLQDHLARFAQQYDQLVAFKPTGWTFSEQVESVDNIQPQISGNISIYGIPYSEHSSFLELKRFVQWLQPLKIIPTVNNGSWASRKAMEKCFSEWLTEARNKL
ncbi:DNA cross-link repair 1A protein [Pholidichthys leucotaenia]